MIAAMATTGTESNTSSGQLGGLGALLSELGVDREGIKQHTSTPSVESLKELVSSLESSISDLEKKIASNRKEQNALAEESRKLRDEIRELSLELANEVSQLTKATKRL